jgi:hypothetical protein
VVIYPESFSVKPNTEATTAFKNLFNTSSQTAVGKNLTLPKGKYVFMSKNAEKREIFISNTVAVDEYKDDEKPNMRKIGFAIENVKNMEIDCNDSNFIIDGQMTHIYIKNCENISIKNLTIQTVLPDVHKITVLKASTFYVTFEIDSVSNFKEENGDFYWWGTDYKTKFNDVKHNDYVIPTACADNLNHLICNRKHPLQGSSSIKQISERVFSVRYITPKDFKVGQVFYIFSDKRKDVGIFIEKSNKITLENITQRFNRGHGVVAQNSENITIKDCKFAPSSSSEVDFCCLGDFLHFNMCRGKIDVSNCEFDSCGANLCNVHGNYFEIVEQNKDAMTLRFPKEQSFGFESFKEEDVIAFVDSKSLVELGRTKVLKAVLRDGIYYDLTIATYDPPVKDGLVVENVSAHPQFIFDSNTVNRVAKRGVLCTTRGKVRIENNRFLNTGMSDIVIANDALKRFESGAVSDVEISGNAFMNCEESSIVIKPHLKKFVDSIHKNIKIDNNLFVLKDACAVFAYACDGLVVKDNTFAGNKVQEKVVLKDTINFQE